MRPPPATDRPGGAWFTRLRGAAAPANRKDLARLTWLAGGVLVLMVATVVGLIIGYWHEIRLGRARVEVAARQLADTWNGEYQRAASRRTGNSVVQIFDRAFAVDGRDPEAMTRAMQAGAVDLPPQCDCSRFIPRYSYWHDVRTGQTVISGDTAGIPALERVGQVIRASTRFNIDPLSDFGYRGRDRGGPWVTYYRVVEGPRGPAVLGLEFPIAAMDTAMLRPPYERLLALNWGDPATRDIALRVEVRLMDSVLFVGGPPMATSYAAHGPYIEGFRLLQSSTWLNPAALVSVTPGGLPRVPVALFAGLIGVSALMGVLGLLLLQRTAHLARLREDFASSVSHELRTPLTQILLVAETLELNRPARQTREAAATIIRREARRLLHLVENVLQFAAGQRATADLDLSFRRLAPLISETVTGMQLIADTRLARIVTDLDEDATALADADAVRRIVTNLIDNALRYGPAGQTVRVALRRAGDRLRLTVEDDGPGIPPALRETVWRPFERGLRREPGTGIGLAIVRQLVTRHGGSCHIESADGQGARIVVELPAVRLETPAHETAPV